LRAEGPVPSEVYHQLPLATAAASPVYVTSDYSYRILFWRSKPAGEPVITKCLRSRGLVQRAVRTWRPRGNARRLVRSESSSRWLRAHGLCRPRIGSAASKGPSIRAAAVYRRPESAGRISADAL